VTHGDERATSAIVTIPNLVSLVRLVMVPFLLWLLVAKDELAAAGWLLGVIGSTDWVDGYLARRLGQVSEVGKLLDPVADRLAVAAAVVGGLVAGALPEWFAWALIVREAIIALGAVYLATHGVGKLAVRPLGKLATLMLYAAIAWLFIGVGTPFRPLEVAAWVVAVPGLVLYWAVGFEYFADARRLLATRHAG